MAERWAHGWIGVFAAMIAEIEAERDDGGAV
jgi:hypothetical protein